VKIFIIGSVRDASEDDRNTMEEYVDSLESQGHMVHLPHRDTDQTATGIEICRQNAQAIEDSDEVHIFFSDKSFGSHFDMGTAWGLKKKIKVISNIKYGEGKSFARMCDEWEREGTR
jgi:nucleoside 2-deoxyribosyltransferase